MPTATTAALTMALTMALTTAGLLHRARRVHRRPAARLLLRARRHAPPARALLLRGQPHRAPTLALCLSLSLALALNLAVIRDLTLALSRSLILGLTLGLTKALALPKRNPNPSPNVVRSCSWRCCSTATSFVRLVALLRSRPRRKSGRRCAAPALAFSAPAPTQAPTLGRAPAGYQPSRKPR